MVFLNTPFSCYKWTGPCSSLESQKGSFFLVSIVTPDPGGTGVYVNYWSDLKMLRPLHCLLLNEDQEGARLSEWPGIDFTSEEPLAAAKDKASLEKQSCWEVAPPHPDSVQPQLERVSPGSCYHKEREAELTAAATKITNRDSRERARPKLECFHENTWSPGVGVVDGQ